MLATTWDCLWVVTWSIGWNNGLTTDEFHGQMRFLAEILLCYFRATLQERHQSINYVPHVVLSPRINYSVFFFFAVSVCVNYEIQDCGEAQG